MRKRNVLAPLLVFFAVAACTSNSGGSSSGLCARASTCSTDGKARLLFPDSEGRSVGVISVSNALGCGALTANIQLTCPVESLECGERNGEHGVVVPYTCYAHTDAGGTD